MPPNHSLSKTSGWWLFSQGLLEQHIWDGSLTSVSIITTILPNVLQNHRRSYFHFQTPLAACDLSRYLVTGAGVREGCNVSNKIWWHLNKWKNRHPSGTLPVHALNTATDDSLSHPRAYRRVPRAWWIARHIRCTRLLQRKKTAWHVLTELTNPGYFLYNPVLPFFLDISYPAVHHEYPTRYNITSRPIKSHVAGLDLENNSARLEKSLELYICIVLHARIRCTVDCNLWVKKIAIGVEVDTWYLLSFLVEMGKGKHGHKHGYPQQGGVPYGYPPEGALLCMRFVTAS